MDEDKFEKKWQELEDDDEFMADLEKHFKEMDAERKAMRRRNCLEVLPGLTLAALGLWFGEAILTWIGWAP